MLLVPPSAAEATAVLPRADDGMGDFGADLANGQGAEDFGVPRVTLPYEPRYQR